jgi:hypothetical protein
MSFANMVLENGRHDLTFSEQLALQNLPAASLVPPGTSCGILESESRLLPLPADDLDLNSIRTLLNAAVATSLTAL